MVELEVLLHHLSDSVQFFMTNLYFHSFIHSFIPLFSVDLLQDVEIVMFLKVQEREGNTVAYSTYM